MTALPHFDDIQVATEWPEVNTYRAAVLRAGQMEYKLREQRRRLDECRRRVPDTTPEYRKIRYRAYQEFRDAEAAHEKAVNEMSAASDAAFAVAPDAAQRVWLSVNSYSARLHRERQADLQRRGETD